MTGPEVTLSWLGREIDYLHFASAVGWTLNAGLAFLFVTPRAEQQYQPHANRGYWAGVSIIFGALAVVSAATLLAGYRIFNEWPKLADAVANMSAIGTVILAFAMLPMPSRLSVPRLWRAATTALSISFVPLLAWRPGISNWWLFVMAGVTGAYLILWTYVTRRRAANGGRDPGVNLFLGVVLLALAAGFAGPLILHPADNATAANADAIGTIHTVQGIVLAVSAWGVFTGIWAFYLREFTLPQVQERPRFFGMRPVAIFPVLELAGVAAGFFLFQSNSQKAQDYVGHRVTDEVRAVASSLHWNAGPETVDPVSPVDQAGRMHIQLDRLLSASESYRSAVAVTWKDGDVVVLSSEGKGGVARVLDALRVFRDRPQSSRSGSVFWMRGDGAREDLVVALPASLFSGGLADWMLSVEVDARELRSLVVTYRLQSLSIIGLFMLLLGIAVVYTIASLNEVELRLLKEKAEAESRMRNDFLGMVSHEIRTPLQSVLGYAELAEAQGIPEAAARHVRAIRSQGGMLLRIVQDILDFSALRASGLKLHVEPVDVRRLVADVERDFADRARAKGILLWADVADDVPRWVMVDRVRLSQVLLNLAGNAVKFTARGGVGIAVTKTGGDARTVALEFTVSDTGPGIPAAQLPRLFEPFRKLRDDDTAGGGGVGLGLAISQNIVELLGGAVSAESPDKEGAVFRVTLTLALPEREPVAEESENAGGMVAADGSTGASLAGIDVLLVDDNPYVRELLREFLRTLGARVTARPDGVSALEAFKTGSFDVALVDLRMPGLDGATLAAEIRRLGNSEREPWIVGMSAGVSDLEIQHTLEHGVNDFLLKPVSMAGLAETIRMSPAAVKIVPTSRRETLNAGRMADLQAGFRAEAGSILARIVDGCRQGHGARVAAEAHYLANGFVVLGMNDGLDLCRDIERLAGNGDLEEVLERLPRLRELVGVSGSVDAAEPGA